MSEHVFTVRYWDGEPPRWHKRDGQTFKEVLSEVEKYSEGWSPRCGWEVVEVRVVRRGIVRRLDGGDE